MRLRHVSVFNAQLAQLSCYMPGVEVMGRILNYTQSRSPGVRCTFKAAFGVLDKGCCFMGLLLKLSPQEYYPQFVAK